MASVAMPNTNINTVNTMNTMPNTMNTMNANNMSAAMASQNMNAMNGYTEADKVRVFLGSILPEAEEGQVVAFMNQQGFHNVSVSIISEKGTGERKGLCLAFCWISLFNQIFFLKNTCSFSFGGIDIFC